MLCHNYYFVFTLYMVNCLYTNFNLFDLLSAQVANKDLYINTIIIIMNNCTCLTAETEQ